MTEVILIGRPEHKPFDELIDAISVDLGHRDTETLRAIAEEARARNPEGWLVKMLDEYLDVWR